MNIEELIADLRARINPQYYDQIGTESYERHQVVKALEYLATENERLKELMAKRTREHQQEMTSFRLRVRSQDDATFAALREENERLRKDVGRIEWQPIETAPKDGTHVLLSYSGRVTYGYWLHLEVGKLVGDCGGVCRCPEYDEPPAPFWYSEDGGFTEEHPPTHWMPLPEPPK